MTIIGSQCSVNATQPFFGVNHCRLIDVGTMSIKEIMAMTGLTRPEAKLARGDVLAFFATMEEELEKVLPLGEGALS